MAEITIPWPLTAHPGRRPGEGQGDLVNCFSAKVGESVMIRRVAGSHKILELEPFPFTIADDERPAARVPRGMLPIEQGVFHLWDGELYFYQSDSTNSPITAGAGTLLDGSDRATMAANLRPDEPQVVIVTDAGKAMIIDPDFNTPSSSTVTSYYTFDSDLGDFVSGPQVTSVEYFSGYFVFVRSNGEIVASDLQTTDINALSTAMAEYSSDEPLRCVNNGATLLVFGKRSTEVWTDVGSSPFPFQKQTAVDVGLLGKWTVAGGPNQWGNGVFFVAGDFTVRVMDGYQPKVISNDAVSQDLYDYRDDIGALSCCVYGFGQWSVFSISSPAWTWEYMLNTGNWHRRQSIGKDNWRGRFSALFEGSWYVQMEPTSTVKPQQDTALEWVDSPDADGYLAKLDATIYTEAGVAEGGEAIPVRVESAAIKEYPVNFRLPSVEIDITTAVGGEIVTQPLVGVSWSHNGGASWGNTILRDLGGIGEFSRRIVVRNLGRSTHHGVRIRLDVTDPVPVVLMGGLAPRAQPSRPRGI